MFRKILFWSHLVAGIATGLVILMMSVTGVLLTYEKQILAWSASRHHVEASPAMQPMKVEALMAAASLHDPEFKPSSVVLSSATGAPIVLQAGRAGSMALNPYTGEQMATASEGLEHFFGTMTAWHRWFGAEGESRGTARAITGASNLVFLFLILSGLYLWLPRLWKWVMFKTRLLFRKRYPDSKARDYNWHHVMGIWSAIPLAIVVATATVFSYGWANNLVYRSFGEEPPSRGRGAAALAAPQQEMEGSAGELLSTDLLLAKSIAYANKEADGWQQLNMTLPAPGSATVDTTVDLGNGTQPHLRHTVTIDALTGEPIATREFSDQSPGQRARFIIRFLHTGEVLGFWGQTIAGLVSFTSILMVWTGFALAWRRLISPLFRKNSNLAPDYR